MGKKILKNLDDQSFLRSKKASREVKKFLEDSKSLWIRILRKYSGSFKEFQESWKEAIRKIPVDMVKKLTTANQSFIHVALKYRLNITPLFIAVEAQDSSLLEYLIAKTSNRNTGCSEGVTPLHWAVYRGNLDCFRLIFEKVGKTNPVCVGGWTPLHVAAFEGQFIICRFIGVTEVKGLDSP